MDFKYIIQEADADVENDFSPALENHLKDYLDFSLTTSVTLMEFRRCRKILAIDIASAYFKTPSVELIRDIKRFQKQQKSFVGGIVPWLHSIGLPQYSIDILSLLNFHHTQHKWFGDQHKIIYDAKSLIMDHLGAPIEHKQRILFELDKLILQAKKIFSDIPIQPLFTDETYYKEIGEGNAEIKRKEDFLRKLFVSTKEEDMEELSRRKNGDELLVDFFQTPIPQNLHNFSPNSLLFKNFQRKDGTVGAFQMFSHNWGLLTSGIFEGMDWSNIIAAGGSVLGCLLQNFSMNDLIGTNGFHNTDIDLFIYGLSPTQATKKVQQVIAFLQSKIGDEGHLLISQHSITYIGVYPYRHIQFVLRAYKSISEVLIGFDIDCCSVAFDGKRVLAIPRSIRAIHSKCNIVDMSRRSFTYESRLFKYGKRGFVVAVPALDKKFIDTHRIRNRNPDECYGLTKLLVSNMKLSGHRTHRYRLPGYSPNYREAQQYQSIIAKVLDEEERKAKKPKIKTSDYGFLPPWGFFTKKTIDNFLKNNIREFSLKDGSKVHFISVDEFIKMGDSNLFSWIIENPGRQMFTGSFHPIEDTKWDDRSSWDTRVPMSANSPVTLSDFFERFKIYNSELLAKKATFIFLKIIPGVGLDVAASITSYMQPVDIARFTCVCRSNVELPPKVNPIPAPLQIPKTSKPPLSRVHITQYFDLYSNFIKGIMVEEKISAELTPTAMGIMHSLISSFIEKIINQSFSFFNLSSHGFQWVTISSRNIQSSVRVDRHVYDLPKYFVSSGTKKVVQVYNEKEFDLHFFAKNFPIENEVNERKDQFIFTLRLILKLDYGIRRLGMGASHYLFGVISYLVEKILKSAEIESNNNSENKSLIDNFQIAEAIRKNVDLHFLFLGATINSSIRPNIQNEPKSVWRSLSEPDSPEITKDANSLLDFFAVNLISNIIDLGSEISQSNSISFVVLSQAIRQYPYFPVIFGNFHGFYKCLGQEHSLLGFNDVQMEALLNDIESNLQSSESSPKTEFIFSNLATPIDHFEKLLEKANRRKLEFSKEAKNAFQCYLETVIRELIGATALVSKYTQRNNINADDISLVLKIRGMEDLIGIEPMRMTKSEGFISYHSKFPNPTYTSCISVFGLQIANEIHKLKKREMFSISNLNKILSIGISDYRSGHTKVQKAGLFIYHEIIESHLVDVTQSAVLCAKHLGKKRVNADDLQLAVKLRVTQTSPNATP